MSNLICPRCNSMMENKRVWTEEVPIASVFGFKKEYSFGRYCTERWCNSCKWGFITEIHISPIVNKKEVL